MPARVPLHPLLFALAVPLSLLVSNLEQVRPAVATRSLLIAATFALLFWIVVRAFSGSWRQAAVFASILIILFSTYGLAYSYFRELGELGWELSRHRYMLPVWLALIGVSMLAASRIGGSLGALTIAFNFAGFIMVLLPLTQIARYEVASSTTSSVVVDPGGSGEALAFSGEDQPPDIYYIIPDAYARDDYLLENYGHDNLSFLNTLELMGFYVARCSQSNYAQTHLSLASTLNLSYLERQGESIFAGDLRRSDIDKLIKESFVVQQLQRLEYSIVAFETGFFFTELDDADYYYELPKEGTLEAFFDLRGINAFEALLIQNTGFRLLTDTVSATGALAWALPDLDSPSNLYRERTLHVLGQLEPDHVPALRGPKFVFVHLIAPHYPYVFDRDGAFLTFESDLNEKKPYIDQLAYLNGRLERVVRNILSTAETPPIIILQADHGNLETGGERTAILNAYYLPETEGLQLYPQISPVNSFRLIFDNYFGGGFGLLPDVSLYSTRELDFDFVEMLDTREGCDVSQ